MPDAEVDPPQSVYRNEDQICCYRSISQAGLRIVWELTTRCNLRCHYCFVDEKAEEAAPERVMKIAAELVECGVKKIMLSGGEPLLFRDIEALIRFLVKRGVLVKLLTNGTIEHGPVFQLIESEPSVEVSISLDTTDARRMAEITKCSDSLARIENTIDRLGSQRIDVVAVVLPESVVDIDRTIDWVAERGIRCITFNRVLRRGELAPNPHEIQEFFERLDRKRRQYDGRLTMRTVGFRPAKGEICAAGRNILFIDAAGNILPCTATDNSNYREAVRGKTVQQVLQCYRETLPSLSASQCLDWTSE